MAKKTKREQEETLIDLVEAKDKAQNYLEENQLILSIIFGGLALVIGGYFAYKYLFKVPKEAEASEQLYRAEFQFQQDSFQQALLNPGGGYSGFLDIIDEYGGTKAGNLAKYYAGVSYLNIGKYEAARSYLEDFKPAGNVSPIMKFGTLGDAYSELGEFDKAISNYKKACSTKDNSFLTPYYLKKLGMLQHKQGNLQAALDSYKKIKKEYNTSFEGNSIDKYIKTVELAM